ncbi:hypothetical protein G9A89_014531 [Geosiphon pyriformis]|nr:hypothetical protein G9A89_014531 [Geosiphon pyriformis]
MHISTNIIPPATISSDESLAAIFPFELKENTTIPLFSGAALEEKPITAMYTDARVDGHLIKLILDSGSAGSIITRQLMDQLGHRVDRAASARIITANGVTKTLIGKINNFLFEVNGIMTPIKVLVMEATQYQALVDNDWLSKANATLDWNTQELQLTYQSQHICVLATCGHFKTPPREKLLIKLEEEKKKPTWEAYQVSWVDEEHNKLPPILFWDDNYQEKEKQKEELTWETNDLMWTDHNESKPTSSWEWEEDNKNKGKGKEKETTQTTTTYNTYTTPQQSTYHRPKLIYINYGKKLLSMGACCGNDEEYSMTTKFYIRPCIFEHFGRPKQVGKWDNQPCLACGETFLDEEMWHNISGHGGICNVLRAVQQLDSYPHDDDEIWQIALAKIKGTMPEEIKMIKDNLPESLELDWDAEPIINLLDLEQFHKHYQELYCDECDLIYNPPPRMIYTIPEEKKPISSCASKSQLPINHDSNSNNDDDNNGSSSVQKGNDNDNDSNSDTNSNVNYEQYIALPDLSKEQELK